jgi:signal transduction histidine kinase
LAARPRFIERKSSSWFQNGACSASIGTEFGNHLGNVGLLDIVQETDLDTEQKRLVSNALQSSEHLTSIIDDVLKFSKLEAGQIKLKDRKFDPVEIFQEVAELYRPSCEERNIELNLRKTR